MKSLKLIKNAVFRAIKENFRFSAVLPIRLL